MMIDDLMDMKVSELLDEYCLLHSPECDYNYGIGKWDDAQVIWEEFDLFDMYCFDSDYLIPLNYDFEPGIKVLGLDDLKQIMARLGVPKKQSCPICGSEDYHYNTECMVCQECGHKGEPKYEEIQEEE